MGFVERAVDTCKQSLSRGVVSERQVRDVLRVDTDGIEFVPFLSSEEMMVRRVAARIVAEKGPVVELVRAAQKEKDRALLVDILEMLGSCQWVDEMQELEPLLASEDAILRDAAIDMFRKQGKANSLLALVFSEDDHLVNRVKRYLNEKGQSGEIPRP